MPELQEAGFWGRARELWWIERAFVVQGTRRITISGFGGQGKTYLAVEAGRWLLRTGLFERICFVDYSRYQGSDPVAYALSELRSVLAENLIDAEAVQQCLQRISTLVILDNVEVLERQAQQEILTVAKGWSEAGSCRVLVTTRQLDLGHLDYPNQGSLIHQRLMLDGLRREDALAYFQKLMEFPPTPLWDLPEDRVVLGLFKQVGFHPLAIGVLAGELKVRHPAELGQQLEVLVRESPENSLIASLNLSLERLDPEVRALIPRLGVFQGGAMEPELLAITEFSESEWQRVQQGLQITGLIQIEQIPGIGVPYLKFHPALTPALWSKLDRSTQEGLLIRHRQRYYQLSRFLYDEDQRNPLSIRAIAVRELPNLLAAVNGSLAATDPMAVEFVDKVNRFLGYFGLNRDRAALSEKAVQAGGEIGSQPWFLSRSALGEQLYDAGRIPEAVQMFQEILAGLGTDPSPNRCLTLDRLGRCFQLQNRSAEAIRCFQQALDELDQLEESSGQKRQKGALLADLADTLRQMGDYANARQAYEGSLAIATEIDDERMRAVANGQLGTLSLAEGNLAEADQRYQETLRIFRDLGEPASEAIFWHQLGLVYQSARQWEASEQTYRESARIKESLGNLAGAARSWGNLAIVLELAEKPSEAELWYRKSLEVWQMIGDQESTSLVLTNLAALLQTQPDRLSEARLLAEQALAITQTLDPGASEIWKIYAILAGILDQQQEPTGSAHYRRLARQSRFAFPGTRYQLKRFGPLILEVIRAVQQPKLKEQLDPMLEDLAQRGWTNLASAIRRFLGGEWDEDVLCDRLDPEEGVIVMTILRSLDDPSQLQGWLSDDDLDSVPKRFRPPESTSMVHQVTT